MPKKQSLNKKDPIYFNALRDFAYSETENAINRLSEHIRELDELPILTKIEKSTLAIIKDSQEEIKEIFKDLYDGERLDEISDLTDFLFCYYSFFLSYVDVKDNALYANPPHVVEKSLHHRAVLALCLVQLLKSDVARIRKHVYKCQLCGSYFISIKIHKEIKYCPGYCRTKNKKTPEERSAYDKKRNKILKKNKNIQKKKLRINEIMIARNCTKEEAEQHYIQEKELDLTTE